MQMTPNQYLLQQVEDSLAAYWQAEYEAYQQGTHIEEDLWKNYEINPQEGLLPQIEESFHFYLKEVEEEDCGSVWVYRLPVSNIEQEDTYVILVLTETDGDDGWIEVFDTKGILIGTGRTYIEVIHWEDQGVVRETVRTGEMPEELLNLMEATLWDEEE